VSSVHNDKGSAIGQEGQSSIACNICHTEIGSNFLLHPKSNTHIGQVQLTDTCVGCHWGDRIYGTHSGCSDCHDLPDGGGVLKDGTRGFGSALSGPGDCGDACGGVTRVAGGTVKKTFQSDRHVGGR